MTGVEARGGEGPDAIEHRATLLQLAGLPGPHHIPEFFWQP
ncbi:hypothetical protein ADIMK_1399 [Marinobacterium lacunae]|uniref:Uncharacterized protein n=1 Tax=Marinobacterium lacunae TaxID=1232683 RepID=A0A081G048_9GAMM|nr:hypothetical protein ADIMK_1399 [Marinobacterium lacunae]